ncbi:MAG TPA: hypothetical protein V6C97_11760 [Oculatellaceae cyanobacterium]
MSIAEADVEPTGATTNNERNGKRSGDHDSNQTQAQNDNSQMESNSNSNSNSDCLAQAQVNMPWLDFNARLQLKGNPRKTDSQSSKPQNGGFKLPGFSIRKKGAGEKSDKKSRGPDDSIEPELTDPKKVEIWSGWNGLAVTIAGIFIPALLSFCSLTSIPKRLTLVLLNHPVETLIELFLILVIPLTNYLIWSSLCKGSYRFSLWRGLSLGSAIGSSLVVVGVCIAAVFAGQQLQSEIGTEFATGFIWIALLYMLVATTSLYVANRTRLLHDFAKSRLRVATVTTAGALMSILAFVAAEARPWCIRIAEEKALSNVATEREDGWKILRELNPEKEILMECSDSRAAGLCGLFLPIKSSTQHQLYFTLTGKPYSFKDIASTDLSSMPDDYLSRHVVGDKVPGLSVTRSSLTGLLHPDTLSSTLDWTFVFKNQAQSPQELRAEVGLPPGAVITGLTLWNKGEPKAAAFAASGKAEKYLTSSSNVSQDSPAVVTDLGHGRMLLHCAPVKDGEELKVKLRMVTPLKPDGSRSSTLALPRLIAENFEVSGEHQIRLRSNQALSSTSQSLTSGNNPDGSKAIFGALTEEQIENATVLISAARNEFGKPVFVLDKRAIAFKKIDDRRRELLEARTNHTHTNRLDAEVLTVSIDGSRGIQKQFEELTNALERRSNRKPNQKKPVIKAVKPQYVVEKMTKIAAPAPKNLVVVVDGSATVKEFKQELTEALSNLPNNVPARIVFAADDDKAPSAVSMSTGLTKLQNLPFIGGHDNLKAVVKASELAGETERGAVLWIHGPQPSLNQEIYIMAPYTATPAFYELPLGGGETDTYDLFKNHSEIGPFAQVPRTSRSVSEDLQGFFSKWRANENDYETNLSLTSDKPENARMASVEEGRELLALQANEQVNNLITDRHIRKAARVAVAYGLISPVSCAIVSATSNSDMDIDDLALATRTSWGENSNTSSVLFANALPGGVPGMPAQTGAESPSSNESDGNVWAGLTNGPLNPGTATAIATSSLSGATNGTIGPQGADATYVTGVNTAGTVRVNNLANLEALLNIIANLTEIGGMLLGGIIVLHSFANKTMVAEILGREIELGQAQRMAIGLGLILLALSFPGIINWFVASARDANLFS